ncbi:MAG: hypothetical protein RLY14_2930, partial [Planctomycetota bacterium]
MVAFGDVSCTLSPAVELIKNDLKKMGICMSKGQLITAGAVILFSVFSLVSVNAQQTADSKKSEPTMVYFGGDILTMRGAEPEYVESLVVKEGKIAFVGPLSEAKQIAGADAKGIDLKGKTLLPGFIDTHGHFVYFGKNLVDANLFG